MGCIRSLKNDKATGSDKIYVELLKAVEEELYKSVHNLIYYTWKNSPEEWIEGKIIPLTKQGELTKCCSFFSCITVLNVTYKILTMVIKEKPFHHFESVMVTVSGRLKKGKISELLTY